MSRRTRGNARQRLQMQLQEQKRLEEELQSLNNAMDPKECAKNIIEFVQKNGTDPMTAPEYFGGTPYPGNKCCVIL